MFQTREGIQDILKKGVLSALFWSSESGKFIVNPKHCSRDAHWYVLIYSTCVRTLYTYSVGFNVVCSDLQAIPEPRMAEQQ